jgi:alkyl hydroperoxide reductase subunit AhpC
VAISTDDLESSRALKTNKEGVKFPMPILADPKLDRFHAYRAHDDFENVPLHGTFLIDAKGFVRFQRISADPFLDVDFIKKESARVSKF